MTKIKLNCLNNNCQIEFDVFKYKYEKDNIRYSFCPKCRINRKKCSNCGTEHFRVGVSCSKTCAEKLKKISYLKSCGTEHNFSKKSKSREKFEDKLLQKYGVKNVFQLNEVKEKIRNTFFEKYGVDHIFKVKEIINKIKERRKSIYLEKYGVDHPFKNNEIREKIKDTLFEKYGVDHNFKIKEIIESSKIKNRKTREDLGIWKKLDELSEIELYYYKVWKFTFESIDKFGKEYLKFDLNDIKKLNKEINEFKQKISIDHKYSIMNGFNDKIPPHIIGSIFNLELLSRSENSKKLTKNSITKEELINLYENKKY